MIKIFTYAPVIPTYAQTPTNIFQNEFEKNKNTEYIYFLFVFIIFV